MPIVLYATMLSPPSLLVRTVAKALGVEMNLQEMHLNKKDHLKPDYLKMNPQHTMPTINDNGFILWESRVIITYLVNQYARNHQLYPEDAKKRAIIDQRLQFDQGTLYDRMVKTYYCQFFSNAPPLNASDVSKVAEALNILNILLEKNKFTAGDSVSLADYALFITVAMLETVWQWNLKSFPHVDRWFNDCKKELVACEEIVMGGVHGLLQHITGNVDVAMFQKANEQALKELQK